jgi:hypothetical protein
MIYVRRMDSLASLVAATESAICMSFRLQQLFHKANVAGHGTSACEKL